MPENPRIEELRRRVQADPASIAFAGLAEEFRRVGRYDEAIETCRIGLQRHPAYLSARVTLGRALIETGDFEGAREELETVLRSAPENLAAIRGLAQIHERLGHSTEMDPHLAALAHDIPASPPPPLKPARAAAPTFDLDLNVNVAPPGEPGLQFPADDPPSGPAAASIREYDGFGNAFSSPSADTADPPPALPSPTESFGFTAPVSPSLDVAASDAFDCAASEPVVPDPAAPARDVFDVAASETVVLDAATPPRDVFDLAAFEPVRVDSAAPAADVFDLVTSEAAVVDTAARSEVFNEAASEPAALDTTLLLPEFHDAVIHDPEALIADPSSATGLPMAAAEPSARRSPDFDLGLTFTLPPAPAPRGTGTDFSFEEPAADTASDALPIEFAPDLPPSVDAKPEAEEIFHADVLQEDGLLQLRTLEPSPDPDRAATLQRLEGFLAAIQGSRVHGPDGQSPGR